MAEGMLGLERKDVRDPDCRSYGVAIGHVLIASYSSRLLSCLRRSFAHFANSSCELVLFISRLS